MTAETTTGSSAAARAATAASDRGVGSTSRAGRAGRALWRWLAIIALPFVLLAVSVTLRFAYLDHPDEIYFDEVYYVEDARELLEQGVEKGFVVHPPVGKWLIAAGMAVFGDGPVGWRAGPAIAGSLLVVVVYFAGIRLFRRRGIAALAALFVALDGLMLTMSRIAMLDIFLALLTVLGFWLLLVDRDRQWIGVPPPPGVRAEPPMRPHGARWLAGIVFGIAVATKWGGFLVLGAALAFVLLSELAWRRRYAGRMFARPGRLLAHTGLTLLVVPAFVYVATYIPWFANYPETRQGEAACNEEGCSSSLPQIASSWWREQVDIAQFHRNLDEEHPYRASAATWPLMLRPVAYHYEDCDAENADECTVTPGKVSHILGMGNPAVWWLAVLAYPLLVFYLVAQRDWRAGAVLLFLLLQYLPWLLVSLGSSLPWDLASLTGGRRPVFLFYMTPIVPFIALGLGYLAWRATQWPVTRWVPPFLAILATAAFLYWYPVLTGLEISQTGWHQRMWLGSWI